MSAWVNQIFRAGQAHQNGIVRRSARSVRRYTSEEELERAVRKRGFHLVRSRGQYIVFCHRGNFRLIC